MSESPKTKKLSACNQAPIMPWVGDVPLMGPDKPRDNGQIEHLIQYLVTVRERFGNTRVREDITLCWGSTALWKCDSQKAEIEFAEAYLENAERDREALRQTLQSSGEAHVKNFNALEAENKVLQERLSAILQSYDRYWRSGTLDGDLQELLGALRAAREASR